MSNNEEEEVENRIYQWMKQEGIKKFDPASISEDYYSSKKSFFFKKFSMSKKAEEQEENSDERMIKSC